MRSKPDGRAVVVFCFVNNPDAFHGNDALKMEGAFAPSGDQASCGNFPAIISSELTGCNGFERSSAMAERAGDFVVDWGGSTDSRPAEEFFVKPRCVSSRRLVISPLVGCENARAKMREARKGC
jgi:hypothetical protein